MKKKIFAISDIHGFYTEMITSLKESGYDEDNPEHLLIVCGDKFDREREDLSMTAPTIFNDINKYAEETVYSEISASDMKSNDLPTIVKNKTKT